MILPNAEHIYLTQNIIIVDELLTLLEISF